MIKPDSTPQTGVAIFALGFRPFFLGAAVFAVLAMLAWMGLYVQGQTYQPGGVSAMVWHAHEMVYGYAVAVIAGFFLTAVRNWTGRPTASHAPLAAIFALWVAARVCSAMPPPSTLIAAAAFDTLFMLGLMAVLVRPLLCARQWANLGVVSLLLPLLVANLCFYAGALGTWSAGMRVGLYAGVYLVLALIFKLLARVLPFFIERDVGYPVKLTHRPRLGWASFMLFMGFSVADFALPGSLLVSVLAMLLAALHSLRLFDWHTRGIWGKPLLWTVYGGYAAITLGFALKALSGLTDAVPAILALHAYTVGGIGLITLGMMARVSLGHTGRNVMDPPAAVPWMAWLMLGALLARVLLPILSPGHYRLWILLSQGLWVTCFALFLWVYATILARPQLDGQPG